MSHHVIISGTGRTGTTFIVQLLTELGFDTGFPDSSSGLLEHCDAGMEWNPWSPDLPYVVKSPFFCDVLDGLVESRGLVIDYAIVPVRDLFSAAESRRDVTRRTDPGTVPEVVTLPGLDPLIPGGEWPTVKEQTQEATLAEKFHELMHTLTVHEIPTVLLHFPRLVEDPDYLYRQLKPILTDVALKDFSSAFARVAQPELVHDFSDRSPAASDQPETRRR